MIHHAVDLVGGFFVLCLYPAAKRRHRWKAQIFGFQALGKKFGSRSFYHLGDMAGATFGDVVLRERQAHRLLFASLGLYNFEIGWLEGDELVPVTAFK